MCGIIGHLAKNRKVTAQQAKNYVVNRYEDQFTRGQRGFGILEVDDHGIIDVLRATEPVKMMIDLYTTNSRNILLHHRSPTTSDNKMDQTHPVEVSHDELKHDWYVMHNGTISNATLLKAEHEKLGYVYLTEYKDKTYQTYTSTKFLDTEAFGIEIARYLESVSKKLHTIGGFTFFAVAVHKEIKKIHKICIGTNGYGGMHLADYKDNYEFASEETAGAQIASDKVLTFIAKYVKVEGKEDELEGFELLQDNRPIIYEEKKEILSPMQRHHMGFGSHSQGPKETGATRSAVKKEDGEPKFKKYDDIVDYVMGSNLGEVFYKEETATNEAIIKFDITQFNTNLRLGRVEDSEKYFEEFMAEIPTWIDSGEVLEQHLEDYELPGIKENETNIAPSRLVEANMRVAQKRMAAMAHDYMPLFKVMAYAECALGLAYQYQIEMEELSKKIDAADPDKPLDEQISPDMGKEIDKIFPEKDIRTSSPPPAPAPSREEPDPHRISAIHPTILLPEANHSHIKVSAAESMDIEAGSALQALMANANEIPPQELLSEAENLVHTIKTAAEMMVLEQLTIAAEAAAEEGMPLKVAIPFARINDEMNKAKRRLEQVAHVVKTAQIMEDMDEHVGRFP